MPSAPTNVQPTQPATRNCIECDAPISVNAEICPRCGVRQFEPPATVIHAPKDKWIAVILAIFIGGIGIHKFYLDRMTAGLLYLIFSWTLIPPILGVIDGFVLAFTSEDAFDAKYNRQLKP